MTLTELRYVVAVAESRHFGRAAERCFVSQPSLSASVKNLEEELGVQLFERGKRGVFLTETGEQIGAQARRALEEAERVKTVSSRSKGKHEDDEQRGADEEMLEKRRKRHTEGNAGILDEGERKKFSEERKRRREELLSEESGEEREKEYNGESCKKHHRLYGYMATWIASESRVSGNS